MTEKTSTPRAGHHSSSRSRPPLAAGITLLTLLAAAAAGWQLLPLPAEQTTTAALAIAVTDAPARWVDWPVQLDASGAIAPWQEAVIGAQVGGLQLTELYVGPGDSVRRGQLLARFETQALRAEVAQAHAVLRQAQAQAAQAVANRDRALQLRIMGGMSEQEISQSVTHAETATAQVESSQAQLDLRQLQLGYATVLSPDDGVISTRSATVGTVGTVGDELFRLIRQNRLEWRGELTAQQLAQAAEGQAVTLALPDGQHADATVRQIAPALDANTRLAIAYADIIPGSSARAGMYAQGRIALAHRPALVVPAGSLVIRDGRSHVFTLGTHQDAQQASLRAVTIGRRQATDVEIVEGLVEGDRVLVQGAGFLNDGDSVRVVTTPATLIPAVQEAAR